MPYTSDRNNGNGRRTLLGEFAREWLGSSIASPFAAAAFRVVTAPGNGWGVMPGATVPVAAPKPLIPAINVVRPPSAPAVPTYTPPSTPVPPAGLLPPPAASMPGPLPMDNNYGQGYGADTPIYKSGVTTAAPPMVEVGTLPVAGDSGTGGSSLMAGLSSSPLLLAVAVAAFFFLDE